MVIGEVQFTQPATGAMVTPGGGGAYPGTYKVGFWYNSESFDNQQSIIRAYRSPARSAMASRQRITAITASMA